MEMEWKWNGNGMEMEWKQNPDCRCGFGIPAVPEFSGGHFCSEFSGGFGFFSGFFSGGIPNFLAVAEFPGSHFPEFSGGSRIGANAAVFKSFPTTGSGVAGRGLCRWVEGSNPTF